MVQRSSEFIGLSVAPATGFLAQRAWGEIFTPSVSFHKRTYRDGLSNEPHAHRADQQPAYLSCPSTTGESLVAPVLLPLNRFAGTSLTSSILPCGEPAIA